MRTLPSRMMRHTATLIVPGQVGGWKQPDPEREIELTRVHVQRARAAAESVTDFDIRPNAVLWFDAKLSQPRGTDFLALMKGAEAVGDHLRIVFEGDTYRVTRVEELADNAGGVHHWEMELM